MAKMNTISMLKKGFFFLIFCLNTSLSLHAANLQEFDYSFEVKGLKEGDTTMIAYYLGTKQYIKDTILVSKSGVVNFKGTELEGGIFLFVAPGMKFFEFLAVEPKISMETDLANMVSSMKVKIGEENTVSMTISSSRKKCRKNPQNSTPKKAIQPLRNSGKRKSNN